MKSSITVVCILAAAWSLRAAQVSQSAPLKDVKEIQILPTVINNPKNVKNPDAAPALEKALRQAVLANEFQLSESAPLKIRISLDEFSGGSFAKRFVISYGAGRSTVDCRIQVLDQNEKEITNDRIRVRGDWTWGAYQGNGTQTKQAVNKFEQTLMGEIEKLKGIQALKTQ